jgi:hypothetical protein
MDKVMKTEIRKIFSELSFQCHTCGSAKYDCPTTEEEKCDKFLFATSSLTSLIIKWLEGKRKEKIDITKKMCHNLEYPSSCLYDEPNPNGATCTMQEKNIPKEKCKDYKDFQVEYEDFAERNQLITELIGEVNGE